jgi:long-subunit fatty acid transport protein
MSKSSFCFKLILIAAFFISQQSIGQNSTSSPYSRYGIGDITNKAFARQIGMGSVQIAFDPSFAINSENPAAYGNLLLTTFEGGVNFIQYEIKTANAKYRTHSSSLAYFDFAFPVKPGKWALGFGLTPYSNVGYNLSELRTNGYGDLEKRVYIGSGGINSFHITTGFKLGKHFSFGASSEYLFGVIDRNRLITFNSTDYVLSSINESTSIGWFHFNTGMQVTFDSLKIAKSDSLKMMDKSVRLLTDSLERTFAQDTANYELKNALRAKLQEAKLIRAGISGRKAKSGWRLIGGLTFAPQADIRARNTYLYSSFKYNADSTIVVTRDTIDSYEGKRSYIRIPLSVGAGIGLRKGTRWFIGTDFKYTQWSRFTYLGTAGELVNSVRSNIGVQYIPNDRAVKKYTRVMQYRFGGYFENSYLKLNGTQLQDMGLSLGLTLPIRRSGTQLHFSAEAGKRGTIQNNLIEERYLRFTFGFTISDKWFVPVKYD